MPGASTGGRMLAGRGPQGTGLRRPSPGVWGEALFSRRGGLPDSVKSLWSARIEARAGPWVEVAAG
jgi:hypothetical protein